MRHSPLFKMWGLIFALTWLGCVIGQEALAMTPMRAVILFDNSGSMRKNDPQRLSRVAAQLFLDLASSQDQVGLVAFSDEGVALLPLTALDSPAARKPFLTQLRALQFDGQTTDLGVALEAGLSSFPASGARDSRDLVLLLTDGKLDLGRQRRAEEPLALEYIRETLLPQYHERGIAVYTIAFTAAADSALLQNMAQATAGEYRFIESAPMLHKAFSELFVVAKEAESIPMQDGAVLMDSSIQEASLVLSKPDAQEQISLVTPQQQRLDATSTHPGVKWNSTPSYDMVQLTQPEPGTWQVDRPSGGGDDIAIIGASTLSLQVELVPGYLETGEQLIIRTRLVENDQPLQDPQRLQGLTVYAEITTPEGNKDTITLQPQGAGEYTATLTTPEATGQYGMLVVAASPTVQRQRTLSFIPQPLCFVPTVLADPPVTVQVTLSDACPFFRELEFEARYVPEAATDGKAMLWSPLKSSEPRVFQTTLPRPAAGQEEQMMMRLRGRLGERPSFTLTKGPVPLPELPPLALDWFALTQTVGLQLFVVNVILGVFGGGGYRLYRHRIRKKRESDG